ncbi:sun protein [Thermincola ferriacetica]|uniref:16S rRNA (cytosine(967)-C(5))-methyltransferase n=1 Tax=Thermincola ferriacetica TaxID=281456 RepID=A0A0L6VZN7_9FIRM|nr:16S rRNA (cytosine(967)-C(5))-methyltransferase RsmB [Thermincola ferriacetica]KNZ68735.1 sun protein [Thermincola ferriacetica]
MRSARKLALEVIYQVDREGAYSNIALNKVLEKYQPEKKDRAFITELVYGTLKRLNTLDWIAGRFVSRPLDSLTPWIRNIIRMGIYQIFFMDKVPNSAACNESVNLARKFGHQGTVKFVNGVLRNVVRHKDRLKWPDKDAEPVEYLSIHYSHPTWMVSLWLEEFGFEETEKLCRANNETPPNSIRTNTLKISRDELIGVLAGEGVECRKGEFAPETINISGFKSIASLKSHAQGLYLVQDESSTMVGHIVAPKPGSKVIDACSAPGGKTTHLAQLMNNQGRILAGDIHQHKMGLIKENCSRLGINIIEPALVDARELHKEYKEWADFVLVDAPCSGLGVLRRRPELRWRKTVNRFNELTALQMAILRSAAQCVKAGGVLVYSTCTVNRRENLDLVRSFLENAPEFRLDSLLPLFPDTCDRTKFPTAAEGYIQFLPHVHGTDGFFAARMVKEG